MTTAEPIVGNWYRDLDAPIYEVVHVDEHADLVEVQYLDGTVEEFGLAEWEEGYDDGEIVQVDAPESL
jgi:hypothetical protein